MRKLAAIFFVFGLLGSPAYAHGGGLNKDGCHNNRKTGDYHCHRPKQKTSDRSYRQSLTEEQKRAAQSQNRSNNLQRISAYRNCTAARAAGAAPVYRGEPGYGRHLDRDNDGIGCE